MAYTRTACRRSTWRVTCNLWDVIRRPRHARLKRLRWVLAALFVAGCVPVAGAQQQVDPLDTARVRLGSFGFTPSLVTTAGYDSNVTREPGAIGDSEFVTSPQVETWLHLGRFLLNTQSAFEAIGFPHQEPNWTFNHHNGAKLTIEGARFSPTLTFTHRDTYARPTGFEINTRSRRLEDDATAGLQWFATGQLTLSAKARRKRTDWAASAVLEGSQLRETLNRTTSSGDIDANVEVTPLTKITLVAQTTRDRFDFSPQRNSDTQHVMGGLTISSPAMLWGSALVGYSHFSSPASGAADFHGVISAVSLGYNSESKTRVLFAFDRYPNVSYSDRLGYYLLTSYSAAVAQTVFDAWEARVFAGRHLLDYSQAGLASATQRTMTRTDYGGSLSWKPGPLTRIGVSASHIDFRGQWGFRAMRVTMYLVYGSDRLIRVDRPMPDDQDR